MPSVAAVIGGTAHAYVPDDTAQIALGYTDIRFYWATSETSAVTLVSTQALVGGQRDYTYNKTDAVATDWFEWCLYNSDDDDESPRSERVAIGPTLSTRKDIRQAAGKRLRMMRLLTRTGSTSTTAHTFTDLVDADASPYLYCNQYLRAVSGNTQEVRRIRSKANTGYAPATGVITTNAFSSGLATGTECELWRPKGDEDSSVIMDESMNMARQSVWWDELFYLTTDADTTEYYMPSTMMPAAVKSVEWSRGTYPDNPDWQPVPFYELTYVGGNLMMTIKWSVLGALEFYTGTIIRIKYARQGDILNNDTDYWQVPLEWASAEAALAFLNRLGTPSGGAEVVQDAEAAKRSLLIELQTLRNTHMPPAEPKVRLPQ